MSNVNIAGDAYTTIVAGENVHKVTILRLYGEDAVVISHYPAIDSPLIPEDYVVPEERAQEEVQKAVDAIPTLQRTRRRGCRIPGRRPTIAPK